MTRYLKLALAIAMLALATLAGAADEPAITLLKGKRLATAMDQVIIMCTSASMDIVDQTRNTAVCRHEPTTLRFVLVQLSTGVRVTWSIASLLETSRINNVTVRNALVEAK